MSVKIKVFFEPRQMFINRLPSSDRILSFSELIRGFGEEGKNVDLLQLVNSKDVCVIMTEDLSGVHSHVMENFDFYLQIFQLGSIQKVLIHNPPHFFLEKLLQIRPDAKVSRFSYPKISKDKIKEVHDGFDTHIIGQEPAKKSICRKLVAQMIRPSNKPLVLMFFGNPGIGKTETAKYLSKILYGNDDIFREQMTMIGGDSSVKYFKSTSHTEESFSKKLMNRKSNIILLDEFALAPAFFHTSFFQMFDEGVYMDQNFKVDVSNSIIICTSNLMSIEEMEKNIDGALLSRFDGFIRFTEFSREEKSKIVDLVFNEIVSEKNMTSEYKNLINKKSALEKIDKTLNQLPNMRSIRKFVEDCISEQLMDNILK